MFNITETEARVLTAIFIIGCITVVALAFSIFGAGVYVFYLGMKAAFL